MAEQAQSGRESTDDTVPGSDQSWRKHKDLALHAQNWEEFQSTDQSPIDILPSIRKESSNHGCVPDRIRINSNHLLRILREICGPNFSHDKPVIMIRPYKALIYHETAIRHWGTSLETRLEEAQAVDPATGTKAPRHSSEHNDNNEQAELADLRCLISLMDEISSRIKYLQSPECNAIVFSDLYLLYRPGDIVVSRNYRQAYRVLKVESGIETVQRYRKTIFLDSPFVVHCVFIDFDGEQLGPVLHKVVVQPWGLTKEMHSLDLIPMSRAVLQNEDITQNLIQKGETFVKAAGILPMHYSGHTLDWTTEVNSTIIIDFREAFSLFDENLVVGKMEKKWQRPSLEHNLADARIFAPGFDECHAQALHCAPQGILFCDDSYVDIMRHHDFIRGQIELSGSECRLLGLTFCPRLLNELGHLTEDELLIMHYRVFGFILETSKWGESSYLSISLWVLTSARVSKPNLTSLMPFQLERFQALSSMICRFPRTSRRS